STSALTFSFLKRNSPLNLDFNSPNCYVPKSMAHHTRRYLLLLLAILVLGFLVYKLRSSPHGGAFDWSRVMASLRHANPWLLLASLVLIYGCYAVRALRWMRFSRSLGPTRFGPVYACTLMGFACTFLLGRAGEPIRPVLIGRKESLSIPGMFGIYVLERVFDMAATAVMAVAGLILFHQSGFAVQDNSPTLARAHAAGVGLLILLFAMIIFLVYFRYHGGEWLGRRLRHPSWQHGWRSKIASLLEGFSDGLQGIRTWSDLGVLVGYSAIHWLGVVLSYLWITHAFGGQLSALTFAGALLVLAFTMVGSAVQFPGVGGGAQVATFVVLALIFGVVQETAATVAVALWLITFASSCLVGVPLLLREGWSMGDLKRMAVAEEKSAIAAESAEWSASNRKPGEIPS
ncbi:MAG: lysylphosphatidylglycerol synthase transmembrane domain-containing protein, partial [Candidatus Acidiferrales bacterium]